jgi:hypothetical protein
MRLLLGFATGEGKKPNEWVWITGRPGLETHLKLKLSGMPSFGLKVLLASTRAAAQYL